MANSAWSGNTAGLASATSAGLVGTGAQTFAGKKTLDGGAAIKGDTSGVAIAAGYVGERLTFTSRAISGVTTGWAVNTSALTTLTSGLWLVFGKIVSTTTAGLTGYGGFISTNSNADGTGDLDATFTYYSDLNFGVQAPINVAYYQATTSTPIYAKARVFGANTTITVTGYAIRIA